VAGLNAGKSGRKLSAGELSRTGYRLETVRFWIQASVRPAPEPDEILSTTILSGGLLD